MILKYQLVNRPSVETDIKEAVDYYKNVSPELARRLLFRIREALANIAMFPQIELVRDLRSSINRVALLLVIN